MIKSLIINTEYYKKIKVNQIEYNVERTTSKSNKINIKYDKYMYIMIYDYSI